MADDHAYHRLSCQIGDVKVLTRTTLDATQIANAAKKELGAFLFAVNEVFGSDKVQRAADLWIRRLEATDWMAANQARAFRRITIQTSAQLANDLTLQAFLPGWQPSGAWSTQKVNVKPPHGRCRTITVGERSELSNQGLIPKEQSDVECLYDE